MFNKIVSTKHNYIAPNISNDMSITTFGDLHYCSSFDDKRLNLLTEYLFNNDSKYLFIVGDIIMMKKKKIKIIYLIFQIRT